MKLGIITLLISTVFISSKINKNIELNSPPNCGTGWKMSEAYCKAGSVRQPPITAIPKITITSGQIKISHFTSGGGRFKVTTLIGTGGSYILPEGTHSINPGTYDHQLGDALISGKGEVHSYICYQ